MTPKNHFEIKWPLRFFYQLLISYCKFIMPKALKWDMLRLIWYVWFFSMIFIKCFKNSILLSGPNRTSECPSYLFFLADVTFNAFLSSFCYRLQLSNRLQQILWYKSNIQSKSICQFSLKNHQVRFDFCLDSNSQLVALW